VNHKKDHHRRTERVLARPKVELPLWKKLLFGLIAAVAFLLIAEGLLALAGFKPFRFEKDPYVGFSSRIPLFVEDPDAPGMLVTAKNKRLIFNVQRFPAHKPKNTYRIFCMGGSTTYGHPYADPTSFAGWLRTMLPKADPQRNWEVINCGGISYASYREALLMEELVQYEPDLFIILTGHNEFLEQRTYGGIIRMPAVLRGAGAVLGKTRLYAAMKAGIDSLNSTKSASAKTNVLAAEVDPILDRTIGPQAYQRDDAWQNQIKAHFRYNLARMADIARSAGAGTVFVTPASNLRSCSPFKSEHRPGMAPNEIEQWEQRARNIMGFQANGQWADALGEIEAAAKLDDRHAELHYAKAQALWNLGRFDESKSAFLRAMDEDICPLRALTSMVEAVRGVAMQRHAPMVDFVKLMQEKAEHGIPGEDWFLDHVHPTIEGNRVLALAVLDSLSQQRIVQPASTWNEAAKLEVERSVESQITAKEHTTALCNLAKVLAWAGKAQEAYRLALRAKDLAPDDPVPLFEAGKNAFHLGRNAEAAQHLRAVLALTPNFVEAKSLLGQALAGTDKAQAIQESREAVALRPDDPQLHLNLAALLEKDGKLEQAAESLRTALKLSPNYAEAHNNLGWVLKSMGQFTEALDHFREAVRLRRGAISPALGLAWLLATHPDDKFRNANEAIRISEHLVELSAGKNWMSLDTLAAAYASAGRYSEAVKAAESALPLARTVGPQYASGVETRLALYQQQKPCHQPNGN